MSPNSIGFDYSQVQGIPEVVLRVELLQRRLEILTQGKCPRILEVGVGSGDVTLMLARNFQDVTCIEPDEENCRLVLKRLKDQGFSLPLFLRARVEEAQSPLIGFDHIILLGVLEHLADPVGALQRLTPWLQAGGTMHVTVNLAGSIHRWLGVTMGVIESIESLGESDQRLGHYRVYTKDLLRGHLAQARLKVMYELPFYVKPLPTGFMNSLPWEAHKAFFALGQRFPELASYIYMEAIPSLIS